MRIVFMGTPEFAVPTLERLLESKRHEVVAVVSQPDRPAGRGREILPTPVKKCALAAGVPVLQPLKVKDGTFRDQLAALKPDVAVVVAYGRILPADVLAVPRHGCYNLHASMLPKYRGAAPIQRAIAACERFTGVSIMKIDEGLDSGPVAYSEEVEILEDDDHVSLANMLSVLGADLMERAMNELEEKGSLTLTPQNHAEATHAPPITRDDARIKWTMTNEEISCLIRAMTPWPQAWTRFAGTDWKVQAAEPFVDSYGDPIRPGPEVKPGTVVALVKTSGIAVKTADGAVLLTRVQVPSKAPVPAAALLNSIKIAEGDQFE